MHGEIHKLVQPRNHKAKVLIWQDLTVNDMDHLDELKTPDQIKEALASIFQLADFRENLKTEILIDLYYYTINFARENKFSKEQTSSLFSIAKRTHEVCVETPFGNVEQCFSYFRELILCHAVKRPPFSIDIFSPDEVRKITNYIINSYFRHYKMYKYVFTPLVRLDLSINYSGMPPTPPPSEGAAEEEVDGEASGEAEAEIQEEKPEGEEEKKPEDDEEPMETVPEQVSAEPVQEESPAASELRSLIKEHLADEIKNLRVTMESKLKESEDLMNQKIAALEGTASAIGGKGSAKSRKK